MKRCLSLLTGRSPTEVERLIETAAQHFGRLDLLVNNAAVAPHRPLAGSTNSDYAAVMETNLLGPAVAMRATIPHLRRTRGQIVNISSIAASLPTPGLGLYSASKAALANLSESARRELQPPGIGVTLAYLGLVRTEMLERLAATPYFELGIELLRFPVGTPDGVARTGARDRAEQVCGRDAGLLLACGRSRLPTQASADRRTRTALDRAWSDERRDDRR